MSYGSANTKVKASNIPIELDGPYRRPPLVSKKALDRFFVVAGIAGSITLLVCIKLGVL